jgi:hypothetical protein
MRVAAALLLIIAAAAIADEGSPPRKDPLTAEMRDVLVRANKVHNKMDRKEIDDAVEALHAEIARQPSEVFVPLAVPHLLRLAPKDTKTRVVLRQALEKSYPFFFRN